MAIYTNFKNKIKQTKFSKTQKWGIAFMCIATVGYFFLLTGFLSFVKSFLLGTFGVFAYVIFLALLTIGTAMFKKKKYVYSKKLTALILICLLLILCVFHISFSGGVNSLNFGEYVSLIYNSLSVGGALLSIVLYPLLKVLGMVGTYVILFVALTISLAFVFDKKDNKKVVQTYKNINFKKEEQIIKPQFNLNEELLKDNLPQTSQLSQKELAKQKLGLSNIKNQSVSNETPSKNFFDNQNFEPAFKTNNYGLVPPPIERNTQFNGLVQSTDNTNNYFTKKKNKSNVEKNLEFLRATIGEDEYKPPVTMEDVIPQKKKEYNKNIEDNLKDLPISDLLKEVNTNINDEELIKTSSLNLNFNQMEQKTPQTIKQNIQPASFEAKPVALHRKKNYVSPSFELLSTISTNIEENEEEIQRNAIHIENTLNSFKIPAKVNKITKGPAVTRFELEMPVGISVNKIQYYANDIAMSVSSAHGVRIEAPIPGKNAVGVEIPNKHIATISLKEILNSKEFLTSKSLLTFGLGKEISGAIKVCDLTDMPHLLVAGSTGSGKSVCLNAIILSIIFRSSPEDVRFVLIDPKQVEFFMYNNLPHLLIPEVITSTEKALNAFSYVIDEMEDRFSRFRDVGARNLTEFNKSTQVQNGEIAKMPYIVVVVDELNNLIMNNKRDFEDKITKLAQKSRAAGIHLILATQRPSVDVITGTIKANLPSRIAFGVSSFADSKTILDGSGAEKLLGKGDMLYLPLSDPEPTRIQGAFVSNQEVKDIVEFVCNNNESFYDEKIVEAINKTNKNNGFSNENGEINEYDPLMPQCLKYFIETGRASVSMLQRRFALGFPRASRIIDQMEMAEYISPQDGAKPRSVFLTMEEFNEIFGEIE